MLFPVCQEHAHCNVRNPPVHAFLPTAPQYDAYDPQMHDVDFCVTLGGDGTVLHLASLFEKDAPLPPIISFAMGSL